jgi:hypothetical protein
MFSKKNNFGLLFAECYDPNLSINLLSLLSFIEEEPNFENQFDNLYEYIKNSGETFKLKKMIGISLSNEYEKYKNQIKSLTPVEEFNVKTSNWKTIRVSLESNFALQQQNNEHRVVLYSPFTGSSIKPICESSQKIAISIIMELLFIMEDQHYSFEVLWCRLDQYTNYFLGILIPNYLKKYDAESIIDAVIY